LGRDVLRLTCSARETLLRFVGMDYVIIALITALPMLLLELAPFALKKVEKLPHRDFAQSSVLAKIGRLMMCGLFLMAILGPFLWFVFCR